AEGHVSPARSRRGAYCRPRGAGRAGGRTLARRRPGNGRGAGGGHGGRAAADALSRVDRAGARRDGPYARAPRSRPGPRAHARVLLPRAPRLVPATGAKAATMSGPVRALAVAACIGLVSAPAAAAQEIRAALSTDTVTVGDVFTAVVRVRVQERFE